MTTPLQIITTADGSSSLFHSQLNETYHSRHGAIQETEHVFIKMGLQYFCNLHPEIVKIHILEMGFGTGLNALATLMALENSSTKVSYHTLEAFPVEKEIISQLNYSQQYSHPNTTSYFQKLHNLPWEIPMEVNPGFQIRKRKQFFESLTDQNHFHLIYFDAFGASTQPELWTENIFKKMYEALLPGGVLVTYAAKGDVRRAMLQTGFEVEKLPGPPGKREMLRATKLR